MAYEETKALGAPAVDEDGGEETRAPHGRPGRRDRQAVEKDRAELGAMRTAADADRKTIDARKAELAEQSAAAEGRRKELDARSQQLEARLKDPEKQASELADIRIAHD